MLKEIGAPEIGITARRAHLTPRHKRSRSRYLMRSYSSRKSFVAPTPKIFKNKLFTVIHFFDGPFVVDYRSKNETDCGCSSTAIERPGESPGGAGSRPAIRFLSHSTICPSSFFDGPLSQDYRQKAGNRQRVQTPPSPPHGEVSCSPFVRRVLHRAECVRLSNSMVEFRFRPELQVRILRPTPCIVRED